MKHQLADAWMWMHSTEALKSGLSRIENTVKEHWKR